jgi:hypothetical protein
MADDYGRYTVTSCFVMTHSGGQSSVFHDSNVIMEPKESAHSYSFSSASCTRVSSEGRGDEGGIGSNRWRKGIFGLNRSHGNNTVQAHCELKPFVINFAIVHRHTMRWMSRKTELFWPVKANRSRIRTRRTRFSLTDVRLASRSESSQRRAVVR